MNSLLLNPINTEKLLLVLLIVAVVAVIFAVLIVIVSKICYVKPDEKAEKIREWVNENAHRAMNYKC